MSLSYSEAKQRMIDGLLQAVGEQEAKRLSGIEDSYDALDGDLARRGGPEFDKLFVALNFWDGWIDARNHEWKYYKGIGAEDWPRLARSIVADLEAEREISDELVRSHFDFKNQAQRPSVFRRLTEYLLGKGKCGAKCV